MCIRDSALRDVTRKYGMEYSASAVGEVNVTAFFGICKYSLYFFTLKVHLFMQGIDETNKSIPYIQRETYWCVF